MRLIFALLLMVLLPLSNAHGQEIFGEKLWFGQYKTIQKKIDDPNSPTGTRFDSSGAPDVIARTDNITIRQGIQFGLGYLVRGISGPIEIERWYFRPDENGKTTSAGEPSFRDKQNVRPNEPDHFGWSIPEGADLSRVRAGIYIFQVRYGSRVLVEQWFNVTR